LAAELTQAFPEADVRLVESSGGVFEVTVDGQQVFSKKKSRRHAEPGEVLKAVQQLRAGK
jgi:selenoprotein W-related protein